ncbi:MAG TPA: hypothetical protein VKW08_18785 [Xanthobacteraceae bacterium]|nr:hypothetical protein [Xanthobacteraceae bacterium]
MCDYSLHGVRSRPAKVADKLVSTSFWHTPTRGFSAVGEPGIAVCLRPGTELAFESEIKAQASLFRTLLSVLAGQEGGTVIRQRVGRFRQINVDNPNTHHDAIEFPDGTVLLVTHLRPGQLATVLQLPADAQDVPGTDKTQVGPHAPMPVPMHR